MGVTPVDAGGTGAERPLRFPAAPIQPAHNVEMHTRGSLMQMEPPLPPLLAIQSERKLLSQELAHETKPLATVEPSGHGFVTLGSVPPAPLAPRECLAPRESGHPAGHLGLLGAYPEEPNQGSSLESQGSLALQGRHWREEDALQLQLSTSVAARALPQGASVKAEPADLPAPCQHLITQAPDSTLQLLGVEPGLPPRPWSKEARTQCSGGEGAGKPSLGDMLSLQLSPPAVASEEAWKTFPSQSKRSMDNCPTEQLDQGAPDARVKRLRPVPAHSCTWLALGQSLNSCTCATSIAQLTRPIS